MSGSIADAAAAPAAEPASGPAADLADEKVNLLLVDDQPANLVALEAMLEGLGQTIVQARSGREALKHLLERDFAVILLDVKMPEMDGFETATLIRQRERSRHTPIIFLTAADRMQTQAVRGYAVGAVDYLVKPVLPEFVRSKVAVFVELAKTNALLMRQAELLRQSERAARELAELRAESLRDLEYKNKELESFSYAVSHDLRAPLRRIHGFGAALRDTLGDQMDATAAHFLSRMLETSRQMSQLIDDVLHLSRVTRAEMRAHEIDLSGLVAVIAARLNDEEPDRRIEVAIRPGVHVVADGQLLQLALENLLRNAWKFTRQRAGARIEFGLQPLAQGEPAYYIRDNGAGFDMRYVDRLFTPFQRLHLANEFEGSGIGLATVQRIVHRHGGRVWAEGAIGEGATFSFTLGRLRPGE